MLIRKIQTRSNLITADHTDEVTLSVSRQTFYVRAKTFQWSLSCRILQSGSAYSLANVKKISVVFMIQCVKINKRLR